MNVLIMGCGRLGAEIAVRLESAGNAVTVMDVNAASFRRLPESFQGTRVIGNGMDEDDLRRAGIENVEAFMAITQGDNRNFFASMMAREIFRVRRVLCRVYDPGREKIFRTLGLETFSPTSIGADFMVNMLLDPGSQGG